MKKILIVLSITFLASCNNNKMAYVDNTVLIKEYKNMKSTEERFKKKSEALQNELDSIARDFQQEVDNYKMASEEMTEKERQKKETQLMQRQQQLQRQQQAKSQRLREESDQVIDSLIDEVRDFVSNYGEEHNYTFILGSNESANIMYAEKGKDITQDVLKELNAEE
ncbi:OmpH family outer membrane protein [Mesonia maritima]|uniref:Outer membrane protein n=1 Tax=Mesonia maritima TaxID=1793873 RepID=A0ABU1K470_9FLAO|nr:OmpH family outer membrane protein [Mesonia maritima]MDR6299802.1 outer membrane protein [Mesonia maritima]